jgi:DNA-binding transcriptional MerR regulator
MASGYTAKQVTRITGIAYQTLHLWAKSGLIPPSIAPAAGRGTERVYSFQDLVALRVAGELRKSGISTRHLQQVVQHLRQHEFLENPMAEAKLVVAGKDVLMVRSKEELISVLQNPRQGCLAFVVDIEATVKNVRAAAEGAARPSQDREPTIRISTDRKDAAADRMKAAKEVRKPKLAGKRPRRAS